MAVSAVGTGTSSGSAQAVASWSIAVPGSGSLQTDDVVVVFIGLWTGSAIDSTITLPSGFVAGPTFTSVDSFSHNKTFYKRLTGGDTGTYAFSQSNSSAFITCEAVALRGVVNSGSPIVGATSNTGTWGSPSSVSTSVSMAAGDAAVHCVYNDTPGTHSPPTGWTEAVDDDCACLNYLLVGSAGTVTASGQTISSSSAAGQLIFGITAAGGAATANGGEMEPLPRTPYPSPPFRLGLPAMVAPRMKGKPPTTTVQPYIGWGWGGRY